MSRSLRYTVLPPMKGSCSKENRQVAKSPRITKAIFFLGVLSVSASRIHETKRNLATWRMVFILSRLPRIFSSPRRMNQPRRATKPPSGRTRSDSESNFSINRHPGLPATRGAWQRQARSWRAEFDRTRARMRTLPSRNQARMQTWSLPAFLRVSSCRLAQQALRGQFFS
jgi:hypothetical protein